MTTIKKTLDELSISKKRLLKLKILQQALIDGENSGKSTPLNMQKIIAKAKRKAGLLSSNN